MILYISRVRHFEWNYIYIFSTTKLITGKWIPLFSFLFFHFSPPTPIQLFFLSTHLLSELCFTVFFLLSFRNRYFYIQTSSWKKCISFQNEIWIFICSKKCIYMSANFTPFSEIYCTHNEDHILHNWKFWNSTQIGLSLLRLINCTTAQYFIKAFYVYYRIPNLV